MGSTTTTVFVEKGLGRLVRYTLHATTARNAYLHQQLTWPKVGQTLALERHVTYLKSGQLSTPTHYALTDLSPQQADSLLRNAAISLFKLYGYQQVTQARTYFACHPQLTCSFVGFPLE